MAEPCALPAPPTRPDDLPSPPAPSLRGTGHYVSVGVGEGGRGFTEDSFRIRSKRGLNFLAQPQPQTPLPGFVAAVAGDVRAAGVEDMAGVEEVGRGAAGGNGDLRDARVGRRHRLAAADGGEVGEVEVV